MVLSPLQTVSLVAEAFDSSGHYPITYAGKEYDYDAFQGLLSSLPLAEQLAFVETRTKSHPNDYSEIGNRAKWVLHDTVVEESRNLNIQYPENPENQLVARAAGFLLQPYRTDAIGYRAMLSIMARAAGCEPTSVFSSREPKPVVALKYYEDRAPAPIKPKPASRTAASDRPITATGRRAAGFPPTP